MSVTIAFGGQYGSESKGKVSKWITEKTNAIAVVRPGGPNSGHTAYDQNGVKHVLRQIPAGCVGTSATAILPAGSYIIPSLLLQEVAEMGFDEERVLIDPLATIIEEKDYKAEDDIGQSIASTMSGTGAALLRRIKCEAKLARDVPELKGYLYDTKQYMRSLMSNDEHVVIEGTQGWGLSILHSVDYPYVTARDVGVSGLLSETGLSPFDVKNVAMVLRSYPIRVGGHSGPLANEVDWETVTRESGSSSSLIEYTSVTKKVRRVGRFDAELVKSAIRANKPNVIFLNHVDYFDMGNSGNSKLSSKQLKAIAEIEWKIGQSINYVGNGPDTTVTLNEHKFL